MWKNVGFLGFLWVFCKQIYLDVDLNVLWYKSCTKIEKV